jgi:hypothetical protein
MRYQYLTGAGLYNETCEGAHIINSKYMSYRPIYDLKEQEVETTNEDGETVTTTEKNWVITGYEPIETVRSGLPECICSSKASHFAKNGIEIANEGSDHKRFDTFRSYKDEIGIDTAWMEAIYSCCKTGDAAIYIYSLPDGTIEYKVFSLLYGDTLFPGIDKNRNKTLARKYQLNGHDMVDYFTTTTIETWVQGKAEPNKPETDKKSWFSNILSWFKNADFVTSEDGWTRVDVHNAQLDQNTLQVIYLRFLDTPIGPAMQNLNAWEQSASYVSDKVKSTAFSKLFMKAANIVSLPNLSSGEEVIGVRGDIDSLKASDAKYLTPPDLSNIATIDLENKENAIMQATLSIDLQPDILKSGADSSTTLKLLLRREIQWCHVMWPQVRPQAREIINVLKKFVAKVEKDGAYEKLRVSVWNTPWIPQNESETISNVEKLVYAGILSKENARHELNMQYTDDIERVRAEAEEELFRKAYYPAKGKAQAEKDFGAASIADDIVIDNNENPNEPRIDNRAARRDIANNEPTE